MPIISFYMCINHLNKKFMLSMLWTSPYLKVFSSSATGCDPVLTTVTNTKPRLLYFSKFILVFEDLNMFAIFL